MSQIQQGTANSQRKKGSFHSFAHRIMIITKNKPSQTFNSRTLKSLKAQMTYEALSNRMCNQFLSSLSTLGTSRRVDWHIRPSDTSSSEIGTCHGVESAVSDWIWTVGTVLAVDESVFVLSVEEWGSGVAFGGGNTGKEDDLDICEGWTITEWDGLVGWIETVIGCNRECELVKWAMRRWKREKWKGNKGDTYHRSFSHCMEVS